MDMKSIISKIKLSNGKIDINLLDKLNITSQQYDSVAKYVLENGLEFEEDLYLTRRQFIKEEDLEAHAGAAGLWEAMTADAVMETK